MPSKEEINVACERIERSQRYVRELRIRLNRMTNKGARWVAERLLQASKRRLRRNQQRLAKMLVQ
jgi:hypothetical protein